MTDLDAATRERLRAEWQARKSEGRTTALVLLDEGLALLAAYDALLAERDHAIANLVEVHDRWAEVEAAQAQAAPVLAAAEEWRRLRFREAGMDAAATLDEAVAAWRAARQPEGSRE